MWKMNSSESTCLAIFYTTLGFLLGVTSSFGYYYGQKILLIRRLSKEDELEISDSDETKLD